MTGIYKFESPTGKIYIGQSFNIRQRVNAHKCSYNKKQFNSLLYLSFYKHGFNSHTFSIVHELPKDVSKSVLTEYEQLYFDLYKNAGVTMLNSGDFVDSPKGIKQSLDHIEKKRQKQIGRKCSDETKEKMKKSARMAVFTEERKRNISNSLKGRKLSAAHIKKMSSIHKGCKRPERTQGRVSSRKGVKLSDETKKKISENGSRANWIRGKKQSPEHIAKRVLSRNKTINKNNGL